jgi:hypothetical protein
MLRKWNDQHFNQLLTCKGMDETFKIYLLLVINLVTGVIWLITGEPYLLYIFMQEDEKDGEYPFKPVFNVHTPLPPTLTPNAHFH